MSEVFGWHDFGVGKSKSMISQIELFNKQNTTNKNFKL